MKINYFSPINFNKISKYNTIPKNNLERTPNNDQVSFTGSKKAFSVNSMLASSFGLKLYDKILDKDVTFQEVQNIITELSEDAQVKPMKELEGVNIDDYIAFHRSEIQDDFSFKNKRIYLNLPEKDADNIQKMLFSMETAHEYTHVLQAEDPKHSKFLKKLSNNNIEYAKLIMGLGKDIFKAFDNDMQHKTILDTINKNDKEKISKYKRIVPRKCNVKEEMIYNSLNVKNKKQFNEKIEEIYNSKFKELAQFVFRDPEVLKIITQDDSTQKKSFRDLKEDVKEYCAKMASYEHEAYNSETRVAKKIMKIDTDLNKDITPLYYKLVEEALSKDS